MEKSSHKKLLFSLEMRSLDQVRLMELTTRLYEYNQKANESFLKCRDSGQEGDFFQEVKPFADKVKECADEWELAAVNWVLTEKPKNLHPMQVRNTAENIQMVSIRAFFPKTSLKRFNSHIQSIDFILQRMMEELEKRNGL